MTSQCDAFPLENLHIVLVGRPYDHDKNLHVVLYSISLVLISYIILYNNAPYVIVYVLLPTWSTNHTVTYNTITYVPGSG